MSRSSSALITSASPKTVCHTPQAKFVVTMIGCARRAEINRMLIANGSLMTVSYSGWIVPAA